MTTQKRISVAHVIGSLNYGGAENQVVQLLNRLNPCRLEKYLVTFKNVDGVNSRALSHDITAVNVHLKRWGQIGCIIRLYRLFSGLMLDVVQSHMFHANLYVTIAARMAGVPVILTTEHGKNLWKTPIHHLIERSIISPLVSMRVAVSNDIRQIRIKTADVPRDKITVITNCVEIPENIGKHQTKEMLRIGTVGRLVPAKDYGTLITAFKKLIKDGLNIDLIFVGDGSERSKLESMVQELGIAGYVTFTGFQGNVNSFLSDFDVFALSSIREGIPVAMLEAMAMSVPVVATKVGGIPEVIQDNIDGLLVDSRNPEMIADALKRLIQDSSLRTRIGKAGRKKVECLFSCKAICRQYEELYIDLLGQV